MREKAEKRNAFLPYHCIWNLCDRSRERHRTFSTRERGREMRRATMTRSRDKKGLVPLQQFATATQVRTGHSFCALPAAPR